MNQTVNLSLIVEEEAPPRPPEPKIFVRSLATPAGWPWSQSRIAALEARLGAPLPIHELAYQLRRLEPWRWGRPGRFVGLYVRAHDVGDEFATTVEVDGQPLSVQFLSPAEQRRRAQRLLILGLAVAALAAVVVGALTSALAGRLTTEERLGGLERQALSRLKAAEASEKLKEQTRALDAIDLHGRRLDDFFRDLNWASGAKATDAHIQTLHWSHGALAVEVRGDAPPFTSSDRTFVRVAKPVRPGIWLWGVKSEASPAGSADTARSADTAP